MSITTKAGIQNGYYGCWKHDRKSNGVIFEPLGKAVELDTVTTNIEDGEIQLTLSSYCMGERKTVTVSRAEMADYTLLKSLSKIGLDVTKQYFDVFVDSIRIQEEYMEANQILATRVYNRLGWIYVPAADGSGRMQLHYRAIHLIGGVTAKYTGPYSVMPMGKLDEWKAMVQNEVVGQSALELVLIAGLSAVVNGLIAPVTTKENPIVHLSYLSGKGKTTAVYLAASAFGLPYDGEKHEFEKNGKVSIHRSVYGSWGSTENATVAQCAGNKGVVVIFNELAKFKGKDMGRIVYDLSEGTDKTRLDSQMKAYTLESYHTTIISTGENSLLDRCKDKSEGLQSRVMELECPFTKDAEHSHKIKEACITHNGWAAPMLAKYILENGSLSFVKGIYERYCRDLKSSTPAGRSTGRFIEKFSALFMTTAELAGKALGIHFDLTGLQRFLLEYEIANGSKRDTAANSYEEIIEACRIKECNFYHKGKVPSAIKPETPKECWGRICEVDYSLPDGRRVVQEFEIRQTIVHKLLEEKGYINRKTCIDAWKSSDVLDCEKGHSTRKRKIDPFAPNGGSGERVYVFRVFGEAPAVYAPPKETVRTVLHNTSLLDISVDE